MVRRKVLEDLLGQVLEAAEQKQSGCGNFGDNVDRLKNSSSDGEGSFFIETMRIAVLTKRVIVRCVYSYNFAMMCKIADGRLGIQAPQGTYM
jgi:hypothetical protein